MEDKIKKFRAELGLSQESLAALIGRSYQTIRLYERGIPIPVEIIERLKSLAVERKRPDLAMELSSAEWQVKRVLEPGETLISQAKRKLPAGVRDLGTELHSLLDEILQGPNSEVIDATESTLRSFASLARQRPAAVERRRRG